MFKKLTVVFVLVVVMIVGGFAPFTSLVSNNSPFTMTSAYAIGGCENEKSLTDEIRCLLEYLLLELGFSDQDGDGTWS